EVTIQTKTNELVEDLAKQTAAQSSFANYYQKQEPVNTPVDMPFAEGSLFNNFADPIKVELQNISKISGQAIQIKNIAIPRLILTPNYGELKIEDFDLDTSKLTRYSSDASIISQRLQAKEEQDLFGNTYQGIRETEHTRVSNLGEGRAQSPENTIIAALTDFPLVDYEDIAQTGLLIKLAKQAVDYYMTFVSEQNSLKMMIENNFRQISKEIYDQILSHKKLVSEGYLESVIGEPKPYLEQYNIYKTPDEKPVTLESQLNRFPKDLIYTGFANACHSMYRFDSSDEVRLAYLLDKDPSVLHWLRPAPKQFEGLYWRDDAGNSQHRYEPDFVIELVDKIVMIEVKPGSEVDDRDVQEKKKTAEKYCELVSMSNGKYGITKPWEYIIIKTERITITSTVTSLLK
ncbi:MAG: Tn7 transposase TnsA N-terminal domain-containing protein, partial [Candidatus Pacearchaeota archaeon]